MRRLSCLLAGLLLAAVVTYAEDEAGKKTAAKAGELSDPVEILKKVDATIKQVKTVQYELVFEGLDELKDRVGKLQASVVAAGEIRTGQYLPEKYSVDVQATFPNETKVRRISGGTDGETYFVVDHRKRTAYEDIDPAVMGATERLFYQGMMVEFLHPAPFRDEINGREQTLKGTVKVAGEECYEVHVVYENPQAPEATWYFSKKDFLPRRRVDLVTLQNGTKGRVQKTVTKLKFDLKLKDEAFKLKLPDGYTKTDDFAPPDMLQPEPAEGEPN